MDKTNPLHHKYPLVIRITSLSAIGIVVLMFLIFPRFKNMVEFENIHFGDVEKKLGYSFDVESSNLSIYAVFRTFWAL